MRPTYIEVNLSQQQICVYEGAVLVNTFIVSTGLPDTPTVTGEYRIYIKVPIQDMSGPGYYLPDVPWVMYFYDEYGFHGTYWHNNFGTPMSRGCVNLSVDNDSLAVCLGFRWYACKYSLLVSMLQQHWIIQGRSYRTVFCFSIQQVPLIS